MEYSGVAVRAALISFDRAVKGCDTLEEAAESCLMDTGLQQQYMAAREYRDCVYEVAAHMLGWYLDGVFDENEVKRLLWTQRDMLLKWFEVMV